MTNRRVNDGGIDLPPPPRRQEPGVFRAGNGCMRHGAGCLGTLMMLAALYVVTEPVRWLFPDVHGWRRTLLYGVNLALFVAVVLLFDSLRRRRR